MEEQELDELIAFCEECSKRDEELQAYEEMIRDRELEINYLT